MSAAAATPAAEPELKTENEIIQAFNNKRNHQSQLMQRIAEFETEMGENVLVLEALKPLEDSRRAHRLVGGALIEKTVGEVRPEVQQHLDNLSAGIKQLQDQMKLQEKDIEAFMQKYKISINKPGGQQGGAAAPQQAAAAGQAQPTGVLA